MNDDLINLARRAVAADGWTPLPGMLDEDGDRVLMVQGEFLLMSDVETAHYNEWRHGSVKVTGFVPDFSDPLTCQSVPLMVRAKHGAYSRAFHAGPDWVCQCQNIPGNFRGPTELAAWVAALEAER